MRNQTPPSSGWEQIDEHEEFIGGTWYLTRDYVDEQRAIVDAARAADISQIAGLKHAVEDARTANEALSAQVQRLRALLETHGITE